MARLLPAALAFILTAMSVSFEAAVPADGPADAGRPQGAAMPNIVLIFPDNLGWGEVGAYGSVRGDVTPRLDRMAAEGLRLDNFNVEFSCTVSRAALLTGRYAIRTGATQASGMTLWEITIAEILETAGYVTGLFGKWHLGGNAPEGTREPSHQGFDEYYGIPRTSNEAQTGVAWGSDTPNSSFIWEGGVGKPARNVKPYNMETRRTIDRESAERGIDFMERAVTAKKPFFFFYPMTQIHFPTLAHHDFAGTTGAGDIADAMADVDYNVGLVLDAIDRLGITNDTIVFWCTDNGAEGRRPWRGSPGPWSGFYNTVMEGGVRTPCIVRWPGRIPAGRSTNAIVHQIDLLPTLAAAIGRPDLVPADRAIDGVNQLPLFEGKTGTSARESVLMHAGPQDAPRVYAVKWHDWKYHYLFVPQPRMEPQGTRLFHLLSDPREETDVKDANPWVKSVMDRIVAEFESSTKQYPHVPANAPDPYVPPRGAGGGR